MATIPTEIGLAGFQQLEKDNKLPSGLPPAIFGIVWLLQTPVKEVLALREKFNSELVQARTLKIMFDGGEAQHTAVMLQPYADDPNAHPDYQIDEKLVKAAVLKAQANGVDTHSHNYGDATVRTTSTPSMQRARLIPTARRGTLRAQPLRQRSRCPALCRTDVTMQSSAQWATPDPAMKRTAGMSERKWLSGTIPSQLRFEGRRTSRTRHGLARRGLCVTYRPLDSIQVAITRAILPQYGKDSFTPVLPPVDECINARPGPESCTLDAAYVLGLEEKIGSLKVGKSADIVVLEKDLYKIAPKEISTTKVDLTMMNGKVTHRDGI